MTKFGEERGNFPRVDDTTLLDAELATRPDPSGYYARLGVSQKATPKEIRQAFLHLSQRYHTDKHTGQSEEIQALMNERFQELQEAYTVLADERQRAAYDAAGERGAEHLALVPAGLHQRVDIISYVHSLDREAKLIQTANLLSATSEITMNYSTAHLFLPRESASEEIDRAEEVDAHRAEETPAPAEPPKEAAPAPGGESGKGAERLQGNALSGAAMQAKMSVKEVVIDGQRQIVLLPSEEMQANLRSRIEKATGGAKAVPPASSRSKTRTARQMRPLEALMFAVVPKSINFRHSFMHAVNPALGFLIRTDVRSEGRRSEASVTTYAKYLASSVCNYSVSLRTSVAGLKLVFAQERVLSPLWTLQSKLTALRAGSLLQKLELTLSRKFSEWATLENTLGLSLTENGFWRSSLSFAEGNQQHLLTTFIGYHNMSLSAYTRNDATFGVDTNDPKNPPSRGTVSYSVSCSPFSGQTHLGFEAWYHESAVQQYGLAFKSVLPYSFSPVAPPFFVVESTQFAVVNQVSILYARGSHRISIPIIAFISPRVSQCITWLSVPMLAYRVGTLLYRPYARARASRYYAAERKLHIAEVDIARGKATLEQRGLEELVLASRMAEERKGGLVVINARYGVINPKFTDVTPPVSPRPKTMGTPASPAGKGGRVKPVESGRSWWPSHLLADAAEAVVRRLLQRRKCDTEEDQAWASKHDAVGDDAIPLSIDVTMAVQNLVRDSALVLPGGTKSTLVGFCDPDPFTPEKKRLKVTYWFRKRKHTAVFDDEDPVELPQREHLMQ